MRFPCRRLGRILILLGVILLAIVIFPADCWPVCLAVGLIGAGVCLLLK